MNGSSTSQQRTHEKFTEKHGGKVFYVISVKEGKQKKIYNTEVVDEIRKEMQRLEKQACPLPSSVPRFLGS